MKKKSKKLAYLLTLSLFVSMLGMMSSGILFHDGSITIEEDEVPL